MNPTKRWILFKYVEGVPSPLSKAFKAKKQAEKAREKFSERERKRIGIGVVRN